MNVERNMRTRILFATLFFVSSVIVRAQEESASPTAEEKSYPEVPKEYEVGKETVSPNGRLAILYPVRNWHHRKWGDEDLVVYEIANDKIKREEKIWPEVVKYFDRDWQTRYLKKYPKEQDSYTFRADNPDVVTFEFKGRSLSLNILAENRPNLAPGPHWSAELHAVWNLDKAKFEKVDFKPGEIEVRKQLE